MRSEHELQSQLIFSLTAWTFSYSLKRTNDEILTPYNWGYISFCCSIRSKESTIIYLDNNRDFKVWYVFVSGCIRNHMTRTVLISLIFLIVLTQIACTNSLHRNQFFVDSMLIMIDLLCFLLCELQSRSHNKITPYFLLCVCNFVSRKFFWLGLLLPRFMYAIKSSD